MNPAETLSRAAIGAAQRGDGERARELLARAKLWDCRSGDVLEAEGVLALFERRWKRAERSFRAAMAAGAYSSRSYTGLGLALREQGLFEHAKQSFEYALEVVSPEDCPWANRALDELEFASKRRVVRGRRLTG